jgi:hypothetical protein
MGLFCDSRRPDTNQRPVKRLEMQRNLGHEGPARSIAMLARKSKTSAPDDRPPPSSRPRIYILMTSSDHTKEAPQARRLESGKRPILSDIPDVLNQNQSRVYKAKPAGVARAWR